MPLNQALLGKEYPPVRYEVGREKLHRPIFAGDRLLAAGRVAAVQVRGRHELLAIETSVTTEEGEPVCSAVMTLIARGTSSGGSA